MDDLNEHYKEYAKIVYGFLMTKVRNHSVAEELTQETFYRAVKNIDSYQENSKVSSWLCGIAHYVYLEYQRKHNDVVLDDMDSYGNEEIIQQLDRMMLYKMIHQLDELPREVVYLRLFGDFSFKQIGEILGKSENWARVTFYRSKEKLIKEVNEDEK